jgi:hypothetical protein
MTNPLKARVYRHRRGWGIEESVERHFLWVFRWRVYVKWKRMSVPGYWEELRYKTKEKAENVLRKEREEYGRYLKEKAENLDELRRTERRTEERGGHRLYP